MRNLTTLIATLAVLFGLAIVSCDTPAQKVADAREDVQDAKVNLAEADYDLYKAKEDSTSEYYKFKRESEDRIVELENRIAEIKLKIAKERNKDNAKSKLLVEDFEQQTAKMRIELRDYNSNKKDEWVIFKNKFNNNMDELGSAISNFFSDTK